MNDKLRTLVAVAGPLFSWGLERVHGQRGGVILVYHEVSPGCLRESLACIAERYSFVSLSEFAGRLAAGHSTRGLAVITFDDGYGPVVEHAAQLASERGWPMTFYLPTRYLDSREPFWYQELAALLERSTLRDGNLAGVEFELATPASRAAAQAALDRFFRGLRSEHEVERRLRELRRLLHGSEERPGWLETTEPISWQRVRELARNDALSFEAHSVNHLALARLDEEALRAELERCCARIEDATGRRVEHFCYPYGGGEEIGEAAPDHVRRRFRSGTTMSRGRCHRDADLALLPRVPLYEGDSRGVVQFKVASAR